MNRINTFKIYHNSKKVNPTILETRKQVNARMRCNSITKDYISHWNVTTKGFTAFNFVGF